MDSLEYLLPSSGGINGINLANYFPNRRSYNSVVYFHKRFLHDIKEEAPKDIKKDKPDTVKSKKKKSNNNMKHDISQQFNCETLNQHSFNYETMNRAPYNNSVLEQTIRFAKNLVPLVIPKESAPVFYTIKSSRKHKNNEKKQRESSIEKDVTYNKNKPKKSNVGKSKNKYKNSSVRESIDPASQNTLDDINININQSCSFSESTEIKFHKRAPNHYDNRKQNSQKLFISNSFEALATESLSDGNAIKIHLMTDTDKSQFIKSIQNPVINTMKDYLTQINNDNEFSIELKGLQRLVKRNSQKLDVILDKLTCIENNINNQAKQTIPTNLLQMKSPDKGSRLEVLGKDIIEVKEQKSSEEEDLTEEYNNLLQRRRNKARKSVVVALEHGEKEDNEKDCLACGEEIPGPLNKSSSITQLGIKPDRPNRIPARFCWTDADRKK